MEIKVRAKSFEGKWVEGDLVRSLHRKGGYSHFIAVLAEDLEENTEHHLVDAETICLFTTQQDSQGVDIYEGDIIESPLGCRSIVLWKEFKWVISGLGKDGKKFLHDLNISRAKRCCTVIGNVFDNSDLL